MGFCSPCSNSGNPCPEQRKMAARSVARAYRTLVGVHLAPEHWKSIRPFLGHRRVEDAVTNPPCKKALAFAKKLIVEYRYVVLLGAHKFLRRKPRSAMHSSRPIRRLGYGSLRSACRCWIDTAGPAGPKKSSNTAHCRLIWERGMPPSLPQGFELEETARGPHKAGSAAASAGAVTA